MRYDPEKHHRKSIRLKEYDYSQAGTYFVTICTHNRRCLYGEIKEEKIVLNNAGEMVERRWWELQNKFANIELDKYAIMPNHFHGIIIIVGVDLCVNPNTLMGEHIGSPLPKIVQWFKTMTTNEYIRGIREKIYPPFNKQLWQRNYYEHIIRNEDKLNLIREYIINNPLQWQFDRENPKRIQDAVYDKKWGYLETVIYGETKP